MFKITLIFTLTVQRFKNKCCKN